MSAAVTAPTTQPAPDPADAPKPGRFGRVLGLVRRLMDYGKELAATLRQRATGIDFIAHGYNFGTGDIGLILARITQGLHRAQALEERLARIAPRLDAKPKASQSPRQPRASAARPIEPTDPRLALLPTPEQIADKVRHQPIGAVLADICRDLGILPRHPLWTELSRQIMVHGGNLARLVSEILQRPVPRGLPGTTPVAWPAPATPSPVLGGTGPP